MDEVYVHRRIPVRPQLLQVDQATSEIVRPSSAAFEPDEDGLSVYIHAKLKRLGLRPSDVRTAADQVVAGLRERDISSVNLALQAQEDLDDPHLRGKAHGLLQGWD